MIIAQVLKVSTDLMKVSVNVSQVPWNHPIALISNYQKHARLLFDFASFSSVVLATGNRVEILIQRHFND